MHSICTTRAIQEGTRKIKEHQNLAPLGVDKMAKWCNSFIIVPKSNGTICLCLDPARLNQALIRPIHRGPTLSDIPPKVCNVCYMTIINTSSGYHNMKLDKKSSYLTIFACHFGRYRFTRLQFGMMLTGDMFQQKR